MTLLEVCERMLFLGIMNSLKTLFMVIREVKSKSTEYKILVLHIFIIDSFDNTNK